MAAVARSAPWRREHAFSGREAAPCIMQVHVLPESGADARRQGLNRTAHPAGNWTPDAGLLAAVIGRWRHFPTGRVLPDTLTLARGLSGARSAPGNPNSKRRRGQ